MNENCQRRRLLRTTTIGGVLVLAFTASTNAAEPTYQLDIPSETLSQALTDFSQASSQQIIFSENIVAGHKTTGLHGRFTREEALNALFAGTDLKIETNPSGVLMVQPKNVQAAQSDGAAETKGSPFEEIIVTSNRFLGADTSGTTNLPIPIEKVPQSISLVSSAFIKAANLKTLGEIAEYTPGATNIGDPASNGSLINLRGFNAGRAVDGLPISISNGTSYEPEYAIYDRLEVVKGPTSVVYGVSSPGGLVNAVTKNATPETPSYLLFQAGSWNSYRVEGQVAGALDSEGNVRAIGIAVQDQGDSFLDIMKHSKTTVYGGINADLGDSVTAYVHGGYENFARNGFDGMPTEANGASAPVPQSFFIGAPDIKTTTEVYHLEGDLTWHVTDQLELSVKGNYESGENKGVSAYGYGLEPNGDISLSVFNYKSPGGTSFDNYATGGSAVYHLDLLGMESSFVSVSALYQDSRTGFAGSSAPGSGVIIGNIFNGESSLSRDLDSLVASSVGQPPYISNHHDTVATYSAQSVLKLADPLTLLLGVAYSKPESEITGSGGEQDFNFEGQVSYRAGLTYEFIPQFNAYASFSQSFEPQVYYSINANGVTTPLPPIDGQQYEIGLKYRSADGRLLVTGALFQITQANEGEFDQFQNGTDYYKPIGEVTHKGIELEAVGEITPQWQVNAGYEYLDPEVTKDSDSSIVGQTRTYLPKQTLSLFTTYAFQDGILPGLTLGGGIHYVSSQHTSYEGADGLRPTTDLPGYALVDLSASYAFDKWRLQLNARNVLNKHYLINNYQTLFFGNEIGAPANVTATIRREF